MYTFRMRRSVVLLGIGVVVSLTATTLARDRYWEWGWGIYGAHSVLDVARYDWSLINFGNVPANDTTVERCRRILALNPSHRFVVRVWPIMGKGDCPQNRHQATMMHYLYEPGVREAVLAETRRQLRLIIDGTGAPDHVAGSTFLEELPGHFTSSPFKTAWHDGDPVPWDVARFAREVEDELGEPFDLGNPGHRRWWGRKYCEVLGDIHRAMKAASAGKPVLYWQATAYGTLDHLAPEEDPMKPRILPFHYADIVRDGVCDGIFGYPNNEKVWRDQTQAIVEQLDVLFFSQVSTPAFMRLATFEKTVELARWRHPRNLGTFLYIQAGRNCKAWNEMPYMDDTRYWTVADHARKLGDTFDIGMDVVRRELRPQLALDFDARDKRSDDFVHVYGQVINPRDSSWYGGDAKAAVLRDVSVTLSVPDGFTIPRKNSAPATVRLGSIRGRGCKVADWWIRVDGDGAIPAGQSFRLAAAGADGVRAEIAVKDANSTIPALQTHAVTRSGDSWVEPGYRLGAFEPAVELNPTRTDIAFPQLSSGGRSVLFRAVIESDTRLVVGPGYRARLFRKPIFDDAERTFAAHRNDLGVAVFADGYPVHRTPRVAVRGGQRYCLQVSGKVADGAIFHAIVRFHGLDDRERVHRDISCLYNGLSSEMETVEGTVTAPALGGNVSAQVFFYCHNRKGALHLTDFDFFLATFPDEGKDVTDRLDGVLPRLEKPFTLWTYSDRCDPLRNGGTKVEIRFFDPLRSHKLGQ